MPNEINYAEVYQSFIDEELEAASYTQWMVPNDDQIEYSGGKDVKIAQLTVSGLGNYRANASGLKYPMGSVKLEWVPYTMEMDRAVRFELGRLDPSDSHWMTTTENVTRTFSRKRLVPEQDIFRFNRLYNNLAQDNKYKNTHITKAAALTTENALSTLMHSYSTVKNDSGEVTDLVCFMNMELEQLWRDIANTTHNSIVFGKTVTINGISYKCMIINELPCVLVPSKRLQTAIKVNDGVTSGQEAGGIEADSTSKQIEYLITSSEAPMACGKIDSLKVFSADENQTGDETTINYHLLYDLWVLKNQMVTVAAHVRDNA